MIGSCRTCHRPPACVPALPNASIQPFASRPKSEHAAAAAPNGPQVAVLCQYL